MSNKYPCSSRCRDDNPTGGAYLAMRPFVLFDLGGTLVDLGGIVSSMSRHLQLDLGISAYEADGLGRDWARRTAERLPAAQGRRFRPERDLAADALAEVLKGRAVSFDAGRLVGAAWADFADTCTLHDDVSRDWIRSLRSRSAGLALVTDGDTEAVTLLLGRLGLRPLFDATIVSEKVRAYKPSPKIYRAAMKALKASPRESVFVSDSPLDLEGAAALGLSTALIDRGLFYDDASASTQFPRLSRLTDLEAVLDRRAAAGRFERP